MNLKKGQVYEHKNPDCKCFRCTGVVWNKGTKGIMKANSASFKKGQRVSTATEIKKGQRLSPKTEFKKGDTPWSKLNKEKMPRNESHHFWKGEDAGYVSKHKWVSKMKGKPSFCEGCGREDQKRYEWANLSGNYKREVEDYIRLCKSCHERHDKKLGWVMTI